MTLIKTSLLNGIAVVIKMLTLLGLNKILAIYVGPVGYAALGQFQNAVQMITTFASGAINTGVTKYTAEYHADEDAQHKVWRTAGTIATVGSLLSAVTIVLLSERLAGWFLKDTSYGSVFVWFAATLIFFTLNTLLLAILNGKKEVIRYVVANISGSVFALIVTTLLTSKFGLYGALIALAVYQSLSFFMTLLICCKSSWFKLHHFLGGVDKATALNLGKYTAMALASAACVPLSHILVRGHLGETLGWEAAGYWEAMWRLSVAYLTLVTTTLSVYYLPRLSEIKNTAQLKFEIIQGYKVILPIAAISGLAIYLLRDVIISVLFTSQFKPMRNLFAWQIIGDTIKIGSWILGYVLIARAFFGFVILSEIIFAASFVILAGMFSSRFGLEGASIAHAVSYSLYLISIFIYLRLRRVL